MLQIVENPAGNHVPVMVLEVFEKLKKAKKSKKVGNYLTLSLKSSLKKSYKTFEATKYCN